MSGYTPLFNTVFSGSLFGRYPDTAAWVFFLAFADKHGVVDMTPEYIAGVTGMPLADLLACISRFLEPDPKSRSPENEGRRLVLIDPPRAWGWRIVNFAKYRERARLAAKSAREVETGENRGRMRDRRRPPMTAADPLSNTDTNNISCSRFADFWSVYPRKVAKAKAQSVWMAEQLDPVADEIIEHVRARIAEDEQWKVRKYIPYPATFLNQKRWQDEYEQAPGQKRVFVA